MHLFFIFVGKFIGTLVYILYMKPMIFYIRIAPYAVFFGCFLCISALPVAKIEVFTEISQKNTTASVSFSADSLKTVIVGIVPLSFGSTVDISAPQVHSWGIYIKPIPFVSFTIGTLALGGTVARMRTPSVYIGSSLKNAFLPSVGTSISFAPSSTVSPPPISVSTHIMLGEVRCAFTISPPSSFEQSGYTPYMAYATFSAPLSLISSKISFFAGTIPLSFKQETTWFLEKPNISANQYTFFSGEIVYNMKPLLCFASIGYMQDSYGYLRGFFRSEASLIFSSVRILSGLSLIEKDFISFSNTSGLDIVRFFINPQIHIRLSPHTSIPVLSWGILGSIRLQQADTHTESPFWSISLKTDCSYITDSISLHCAVSVSDIVLSNDSEFLFLNGKTPLKLSAGIKVINRYELKTSIEYFFLASGENIKPVWDAAIQVNIPEIGSLSAIRATYAFYSRIHTIAFSQKVSKKISAGTSVFELSAKAVLEKKYKENAEKNETDIKPSWNFSVKVKI